MPTNPVKNIVISGTNMWNPGDDFVRDGVIRILRELFAGFQLNFLFYNFNQDFFPQSKFSGITNMASKGDLDRYRDFIDAVVIAGLSAGNEIKDLYTWIIQNRLHDRVYLIGAGYENPYVERYISEEPEATIFKNARIITGRTRKTPQFIPKFNLPYHHINCPALLSVPAVKPVPPGKKISRIGLSLQLPHELGISNHCCSQTMYELGVRILPALKTKYELEVITHHKSEYFHFINLLKGEDIPVIFSSFYHDLFDIYPRYDLVVTTRLHSSLFANGFGIPGIIINDTDRHTHCLEGFPHSVWVNSFESFIKELQNVSCADLQKIALEADSFKKNLLSRYLEILREPFGLPSSIRHYYSSKPNPDALLSSIGSSEVKQRVLENLSRLSPDIYLNRNIEGFRTAIQKGETWFESLIFLNWYATTFKPANYLEVGVRRGRSMAQVVVASPETHCYGFDIWIPTYSGVDNPGPEFVLNELKELHARKLPTFITGNSHKTLPEFWANPANPQLFDLIFIDGDHTYEGAKKDLDAAFLHLAPGGALLFDDISHSSHPELYPLWNETKHRFPECLFIEDRSGNGTACAFKPPFTHLEKFTKRPVSSLKLPASAFSVQDIPKPVTTSQELPVHFFTIVQNGEPFIRHHIGVFRQLPFKWHWHIIEGVADLKHDTGWSLQFGGKITDELHRNGLSNDGTTEYLNEMAEQFPANITIYRKPKGTFWDGKLEMVTAPLITINKECLLWQVDVDEYWTLEQIRTARKLFADHPQKTAAYYLCNFFVGPELIVTTSNTYGNHTDYEWLRTWRFKPGDRWATHEPPCLCRRDSSGKWNDLAKIDPILHLETEANSLVFNHYAYVSPQQLRFKEIYYGYTNAVQAWNSLQAAKEFPVLLKDYFPWVKDGALVDRSGINTHILGNVRSILWIRADSIGDNVMAAAMLPPIKAKYPHAKITVVCQDHIAELYESSPFVDAVIGFDRLKGYQDEGYRNLVVQKLQAVYADLVLNSLYSRDPLYDLFAINSGARTSIAFNGNSCNISADERDKNNKLYTRIISDNEEHKPELERHRDFLTAIGIDAPPLQPMVWITSDDEKYSDEFFSKNRLDSEKTIALFVCGQWEGKFYEPYAAALSQIFKDHGMSVLTLGTGADIDINQKIIENLGVNAINLAGKTTLRQTAAILKRCRLGIGTDTGSAHIACAVGTPNVVILGGGHFGRFIPYSSLTSIVCLPLECYNCNWLCKYSRVHCIKDINPEVISEAVRQTIEKTSEKPRIFVQGISLWERKPEQPRWQSFHSFLNVADVEIIPVGDIPSFTAGIWEKLRSMDRTAQIHFLQKTTDAVAPVIISYPLAQPAPYKNLADRFADFSYAKKNHFSTFNNYDLELFNCRIDPEYCDLKAYQDLLVFTFIKYNIPKGSRILEIGGGDSRILNYFKQDYECWNIDKMEGLGNGPTTAPSQGYRLVKEYIGNFSKDLPENYFDFIFSISALEHVKENEETFFNICRDVDRVLKTDGFSLHAFDIVLKKDKVWSNKLLPYMFNRYPTINSFIPFEHLVCDPDLYTMNEVSYSRLWEPLTKKSYAEFGKPASYNILWQKQNAVHKKMDQSGFTIFKSIINNKIIIKKLKGDKEFIRALPKISIVTPSYNQGEYLEECITSILGQNYPNLEYRVMDGGSTDGSVKIIKQNADRLTYWQSKPDAGQHAAINEGFNKCTGEIMCWLNSDDKLHEDALYIVAWIFKQFSDVNWIMGRPTVWDEKGELLTILDPLPLWSRKDYLSRKYGPPHIQQESTFWRRSLWDKAGSRIDTRMNYAGDLELWSRFFRFDDLYSVDALLGGFRSHAKQKTSTRMIEYDREANEVLDREINLFNKHKIPLPPAPQPIVFLQPDIPIKSPNIAENSAQSDDVNAVIRRAQQYVWSGEINCARDLYLSYLIRHPFDEKITAAWGELRDREEDKEIIEMTLAEKKDYLISAIVSTYKSEAFIEECLQNLENQSIASQIEIIIVDAASPEMEREIVKRYQQVYPNLTYIRTKNRIGVYPAWNMAIKAATGQFCISVSTNDILRSDACEILAKALHDNHDCMMVYGNTYLTHHPHETFEKNSHHGVYTWPDYSFQKLTRECMIGPHPMWRRTVHEEIGYLDERFVADGDQEFWLRIGERHKCLHIGEFTGLQWITPQALSQQGRIPFLEAHFIHTYYQSRYKPLTENSIGKCSIIIPVFNRVELTKQCLSAIIVYTPRNLYEIIIVDNASTDGTKSYLASINDPSIKIITNKENLGFAKACNQGAAAASSKYLLFLNNDTEPQKGWLQPLIDILDNDSAVAAAGSKLLFPNGTIQHAGVMVTDDRKQGIRLAPWHPYNRHRADIPEANIPRTYQALTAACLLVRPEAFNSVQGFDESYWNGYEDVDLCFKLGNNKWLLVYQPASIVVHHESQSGPERFNKRNQNLQLLQERWCGIIAPDSVVYRDGRTESTSAPKIRPYKAPGHTTDMTVGTQEHDQRRKTPEKLKIGLLSLDKHSFACPQIRLLSAIKFLERQGLIDYSNLAIDEHQQIKIEKLKQLDILIIQRNFAKAIPYEKLAALLGEKGPKIVYEFDDAFGHMDKGHIAYPYYQNTRKEIESYIQNSDLVTVSTEMLKSYYKKLNKNIVVIPNFIDAEIWPMVGKKKRRDDKIKLLFSGTIGHEPDLKVIEKALVKILNEFKNTVELLLWGNHNPHLEQLSNVKGLSEFKADYSEYAAILTNIDVDIALVPLGDTQFNQAKSHIKWLEYSACAIPGIYSNVGEYRTSIKKGNTGIIVNNNPAEWYEAIKILITDEPLRNRIARAAQDEVIAHHTVEKNVHQWHQTYKGLFRASRKDKPYVSIIIPVYNKIDHTKQCLTAIAKNTSRNMYEIIIIDNSSTDGTGEFLKQSAAAVEKIVLNKENLGFAKACNQGAKSASGEYLLFLNNDTEPQRNWLEPLMKILDHDDSVAAVGSKLLYPDGTIQHAGIVMVDDRKNNDALLARNNHAGKPADAPEADTPTLHQALTAACVLMRKSAYKKAGGFDERYWNGYEDVDLCFKLQEQGGKLVYQPASVVIHHESQSGPERFSKAQDNIARLHQKWLGKINPDIILNEDGTVTLTNAGNLRPYYTPELPQKELISKTLTPQPNLVSIVILTFNELKYTKECIESIRKHTPEPHEIILVDNASKDGTVKWLMDLARKNSHYRVIKNKTNLGFAKGCNQGIEAATGEYLLLLNNDVVVTKGWLSGLLECLKSDPDFGIIGPMTNNIDGNQKVPSVGYTAISGLDDYAARFRGQNRHRRITTRRVVGFCLMFKRALVDRIGLLDESFGTGNFEDDDYCLRAVLAGYRNMIAGDVFIHHYGSRSFIGNRVNYSSAMGRNRKLFDEKWPLEVRTEKGRRLLTLHFIEKAADLNEKGRIDEAIATFVEGSKYAPKDARIHQALALMLIDAKLFQDALKTLQAMPEQAQQELRSLELFCACFEGDQANAYADRLLAMDPASAPALNLKGMLAYKQGDRAAAERFFQQALQSDPGYGDLYMNLGAMQWADGKKPEALAFLERGFLLSPTSTDCVTVYHNAVASLGEFSRAEPIFREAKALHPNNKRLFFLFLDLLLQQGKFNEAMKEVEETLLAFDIDQGIIPVALQIREKIGAQQLPAPPLKRGTLSLCMIVKDEEAHLAKCLRSVKDVADEMIVVDTGSTDKTKDIATAFGAQVFDFTWTNDFSEARNFSLSKASGDWILVLDGDEALSLADRPKLAEIVHKKPGKPAAFSIVTRNYTNLVSAQGWTANDGGYSREEAGRGWHPTTKVRLFSNDKRIRFKNAVHEGVEPSLLEAGISNKLCRIPVHHYGKMNAEKTVAKGEDYYLLGRKKLEETGGDAKAVQELAIQAGELKRYSEAVELWERVIDLQPDNAFAYFNIGYSHLMLKHYKETLRVSKKALELNPDLKEAVLNYATSELVVGDLDQAITSLSTVLRRIPDYPPALGLLAASLYVKGDQEKALKYFKKLNKMAYNCVQFLYDLADMLASERRVKEAIQMLEAAIESNNTHQDTQALLARCREMIQRNDHQQTEN